MSDALICARCGASASIPLGMSCSDHRPVMVPICDACDQPILDEPHTPADLAFHPECCPECNGDNE